MGNFPQGNVCKDDDRAAGKKKDGNDIPSIRANTRVSLISLKKAIIRVSGHIGDLALSVTNGSSLQRRSMSLLLPTVHSSTCEIDWQAATMYFRVNLPAGQ